LAFGYNNDNAMEGLDKMKDKHIPNTHKTEFRRLNAFICLDCGKITKENGNKQIPKCPQCKTEMEEVDKKVDEFKDKGAPHHGGI